MITIPWSLLLWIIFFVATLATVSVYSYRVTREEKANQKKLDEQLPKLASLVQQKFEAVHGRKSATLAEIFPETEIKKGGL